jgi:hypothetical protein
MKNKNIYADTWTFCSQIHYSNSRAYTKHLQITSLSHLNSPILVPDTQVRPLVIVRFLRFCLCQTSHLTVFHNHYPYSIPSFGQIFPANISVSPTMCEGDIPHLPSSDFHFPPEEPHSVPTESSGSCPGVPMFLTAVQLSIGLCVGNPYSPAPTRLFSLSFGTTPYELIPIRLLRVVWEAIY